ncbi:S1C family serine protease [Catenuloplanes japonicus]|uniref:S1C family serine protease n=1 Tax=Catenuloplanes japonicus TaxID=33876 RepID=UPI000A1139DB|nr:trypsin-like peptidase domain-containing protein [Catenuloplanes japonicus]
MVYPVAPPHRPRAWRRVSAVIATITLLTLVVVVILQTVQISRLRDDLTRAQRGAVQTADGTDQRLDSVDGRLTALEERSAQIFDPEAVATAVLPSVFKVIAGDFTGSAFAVGAAPEDGKSNVLTAYHVIESVWNTEDKTVKLERDGKRYTATITKVDEALDIALLVVGTAFTGLSTAAEPPASGENVLVVGAPLGLAQSITSGVVSAVRDRDDGPGTMIQFDASVNPGNSGGPVINTGKEVVGIADAKARDAEGIGLAVPIQAACKAFHVC